MKKDNELKAGAIEILTPEEIQERENALIEFENNLMNSIKIPLEIFDNETETLYSRIDKEKDNYMNAAEHAIDHLTMAQAVMFEEFEGRDVNGIYTAFDDLIEKIERYHLGE